MDRFGKRGLTLLLALSLLLGLLAGCGKKDNAQQLSANVYVPKYLDIGLDVDYIQRGCTDGESIYLIGQKDTTRERQDSASGEKYVYTESRYDIYRVSLDSETAERLPNYIGPSVPEGKEGNAYIEDIQTGADGTIWVREITYVWGDIIDPGQGPAVDDIMPRAETEEAVVTEEVSGNTSAADPGFSESKEIIVRRQLDAQGGELACIDLSHLEENLGEVLGEEEYLISTSFDGEGNIYAVTSGKIYVLDPQMTPLFTLEGEDMWYNMIQLSDGTMGIQKWDYDEVTDARSNRLLTIDPEKQDWGTEYALPSNVYDILPGGGEYLFYYQLNDAIMGFKAGAPSGDGTGTGEAQRLFSWLEADISADNVSSFFFLPDGRVAAILHEWSEDGEGRAIFQLVLMTATPRDQLPEKTTLIYATLYLNYEAREKILRFNKTNEKYRIEVRDYSQYVTGDDDGSAALQKLNTEILAGTVPDILDTSSLPLRQYGAKGILEDLWPYIESDPDLGRDALMLRPLEANQQDGKLYEIFNTFYIRTAAGPAQVGGNRTSWTLAELQAALEEMPEGCSIFGASDTRDEMLSTVLALNMDQFVDWDTGECSFDSDAFKALLSFCGSFPAEFSWENVDWETWEEEEVRILTDKQLLCQLYLRSFDSWTIQRTGALFRDDFSYIGYPKEDGSCGSSFVASRGTAMTSACKDKEGAWSFLRETLLPRNEEDRWYYGDFPINKKDFDKMVSQVLEPRYQQDENGEPLLDENGQPVPVDPGSMWITDDMEVPLRNVNQEDVDKVMDLYNAIDSFYRYDEKIYNAVQEVAGQYFAGDKPLDDAAKLIQSKVSLYVNESR